MRNAASNLGTAIKAARKNKKLTQLELSEELGITPRHLQAIENEWHIGCHPLSNTLYHLII